MVDAKTSSDPEPVRPPHLIACVLHSPICSRPLAFIPHNVVLERHKKHQNAGALRDPQEDLLLRFVKGVGPQPDSEIIG